MVATDVVKSVGGDGAEEVLLPKVEEMLVQVMEELFKGS